METWQIAVLVGAFCALFSFLYGVSRQIERLHYQVVALRTEVRHSAGIETMGDTIGKLKAMGLYDEGAR